MVDEKAALPIARDVIRESNVTRQPYARVDEHLP